jgi:prolyl-tRNA editing enzyme YbaK/EbsC (Cys-tRNA(Pro) deacylase)
LIHINLLGIISMSAQPLLPSANEMTSEFDSTIRAHPSVVRVHNTLLAVGLGESIIVMPQATHTAQSAADALGCDVAEIAKSIIFRAGSDRTLLVVTSGKNRVDEKKVAALINEKMGKADADFVREKTGFVIGGVAPIAHLQPGIVLIDEDLLVHDTIYPAAGHPNTMFSIAPSELLRISGARVANIRLDAKI